MTVKEKTHFGYKEVLKDEKQKLVKGVFDSVASKYDLMNDVMSFGIHRLWKKYFTQQIPIKNNAFYLDVASGSGDIAYLIHKEIDKNSFNSKICLTDINEAMLKQGVSNLIDKGVIKNIDWRVANAEELPFDDFSVDVYTISFGLRNVTNIDKALKEAKRVLKPGGHFYCLEFSKVNTPLIEKFYEVYSFQMIPKIGQIITGDQDAYQYLVESIRQFPNQQKLVEMMKEAGFSRTKYQNLTNGVVAIHSGRRL